MWCHCRYSPTILLLRHFDAFSNLSSNDGSPNDQIGINSEVASVIREFTEPISENEDDYEDEEEAEVGFFKIIIIFTTLFDQ